MKIERGLDKFLKGPDPKIRAVLLYGPDEGMVRERAKALIEAVTGSPPDPFRYTDISSSRVKDEPALLVDEAAAIAFGGGRRVVRVRGSADEVEDACVLLAESTTADALVVIEAGEIKKTTALFKLFDAADDMALIACWRDEGQSLGAVIRETLAARKVRATQDALAWLEDRLGGDRATTRGEIEKLALYVGDGGEVDLAAARACVGDSSEIGLDDLAHAMAEGDRAELERIWDRVMAEGGNEIAALRAAQRHMIRVHFCLGQMGAGRDARGAMAALRPPLFWKDQARFQAQLRRWTLARAGAALRALLEAEMACKSGRVPVAATARRCVLDLAG